MKKTNIICPNCNARLVKTDVKHAYQCSECKDIFLKKGNHLEYDDVSTKRQHFDLKYYRKDP